MITESYLRRAGFSPPMIDGFFRSFYGGILLERELKTSSRMFEFTFKMFSQGSAALPSRGMWEIPHQLAFRLAPGTIRLGAQVTASNSKAMPWSLPRMRRLRQDWYLPKKLTGLSGGQ